MVTKTTTTFASPGGVDLECDIYTNSSGTRDDIAFLYFHPGGLVDWGRECIAPWLVQVCLERRWPLISASYRLMPQVGSRGLVEDACAAYAFARKWNVNGRERQVIVGGGSAGFFVGCQIAHHSPLPKPLALFSIAGINTFRHRFFNSHTLLPPEPLLNDEKMSAFMDGPVVVGTNPEGAASTFVLEKLLPDGSKNPAWIPPQEVPRPFHRKGLLYEHLTYKNRWLSLVGDIDPGYAWAKEASMKDKLETWPPTVILHGDVDELVSLNVSLSMQRELGENKVKVCLAKGQLHLYEVTKFIEDQEPGMGAVRSAVSCLDSIVENSLPTWKNFPGF